MAITKSAKKANRQNIRRKERNNLKKNNIKKIIKEIKILGLQKKTADAQKLLPSLYKSLDKAVKSGVIKKNTANRKKSRISRSLRLNS